jgi:acyl-CoA thioester hydrolase
MISPEPARAAVFTLPIEVADGDIDELGHASNIAYLRWVQDAAVAHSIAVGLDFAAYRELGAVFVVRRHEIDYLRPVLRTQRLELRTWIDSVMAAKCRRATDIVRVDGPTEVVVARAMTTWGFIEIASGRPTRILDSIRSAFGAVLLKRPAQTTN